MSTPDFSAPVSGHRKCFQSGAARSLEVAGEAVDRLAGDDERPRRAPMDVLPRNRRLEIRPDRSEFTSRGTDYATREASVLPSRSEKEMETGRKSKWSCCLGLLLCS